MAVSDALVMGRKPKKAMYQMAKLPVATAGQQLRPRRGQRQQRVLATTAPAAGGRMRLTCRFGPLGVSLH
jgi:hypothetical protein